MSHWQRNGKLKGAYSSSVLRRLVFIKNHDTVTNIVHLGSSCSGQHKDFSVHIWRLAVAYSSDGNECSLYVTGINVVSM